MIMPKPYAWAGSRDWYDARVRCQCEECHCNNGSGECVVPSKIDLDRNGQCRVPKQVKGGGG